MKMVLHVYCILLLMFHLVNSQSENFTHSSSTPAPSSSNLPHSSTESGRDDHCGKDYDATSAPSHITSPGYPSEHGHNIDCVTKLRAEQGQIIELYFEAFDVEYHGLCSYDYLEVRDGNSSSSPLLGRFCGSTMPDNITSSGNLMWLMFHSDPSVSAAGFSAYFTAFDYTSANCTKPVIANATVTPSSDSITTGEIYSVVCAQDYAIYGSDTMACNHRGTLTAAPSCIEDHCGKDYAATLESSHITSPGYPNEHSHNIDCVTQLTASEGQAIELVFQDFNVELHSSCNYDYLEVRNGNSSSSPLLGRFCGTTLPDNITSSGNQMWIMFHSDPSVSFSGYLAYFKAFDYVPANCTRPAVDHGLVSPPTDVVITGQSYTVVCETDYELHGSDVLMCDHRGDLSAAPTCTADHCEKEYTATDEPTRVSSPGYPNQHSHNIDCVTQLTTNQTSAIQLIFEAFNVEDHSTCSYDYLEVRDGNSSSSPLLGRFCGSTMPDNITSSGNLMLLMFHSDPSVSSSGYLAYFIATDSQEDNVRIHWCKYADSFLWNYSTGNYHYDSLSLAKTACLGREDCGGITQEPYYNDRYTLRVGPQLHADASATGETSWAVCETESGETCEHSNEPLEITCYHGEITVLAAAYGVYKNENTCGSFSAVQCVANNSVEAVQELCEGKTTCSVEASNTVFGYDPCEPASQEQQTLKYLTVTWNCGQVVSYTNLALSELLAIAEQQDDYSTDGEGLAQLAIDGNTDGIYSNGHVSHTASINGWWKVTLAAESYISYLHIWNRMDCCQGRLNGAKVLVDNTEIAAVEQVQGVQKYKIVVDLAGREIKIWATSGETLQLAEVEVYGSVIHDSSDTCIDHSDTDGTSYRGTQSTTATGNVCQQWTVQTPNSHTRTPQNYPDTGLGDHNYCRNPDDDEQGPWCYNSAGTSPRWEYCDIPMCPLQGGYFTLVDSNGDETTTAGLLLSHNIGSAQSGTVCDDAFSDASAAVICREMGHLTASSWDNGYRWSLQRNYAVVLDEVVCADSQGTFDSCTYTTQEDCSHREDVFLDCAATEGTGHFTLVDSNGDETAYGGLLIAHHIGSNQIGTVCDDGFMDTSATVICREMGYARASYWSYGYKWPIQRNWHIVLDEVMCWEPAGPFNSCAYTTNDDCYHTEDVFLNCAGCQEDFFISSTGCKPCPSSNTPSTDPDKCYCEAGDYWSQAHEACLPCTEDMVSSANSTSCTPCLEGSVAHTGSTQCDCRAGYYSAGDAQCLPCPANFTSTDSATSCTKCPDGASSTAGSRACECVGGHYLLRDGCASCPQNTYSFVGDATCKTCPAGTVSNSGSAYCNCTAGSYFAPDGTCHPCLENTYSAGNSTSCSACPPGKYAAVGATSCYACTLGEYWDNHTCSKCPEHLYGDGVHCNPCPNGFDADSGFCYKASSNKAPLEIGVGLVLLIVLVLCVVLCVVYRVTIRNKLHKLNMTLRTRNAGAGAGNDKICLPDNEIMENASAAGVNPCYNEAVNYPNFGENIYEEHVI